MRLKFKMEPEPEPGQIDGSGSSQIPRLRAAPAPKPCCSVRYHIYKRHSNLFISWSSRGGGEVLMLFFFLLSPSPTWVYRYWIYGLLPGHGQQSRVPGVRVPEGWRIRQVQVWRILVTAFSLRLTFCNLDWFPPGVTGSSPWAWTSPPWPR